jgi:hypothetical protein
MSSSSGSSSSRGRGSKVDTVESNKKVEWRGILDYCRLPLFFPHCVCVCSSA